ncbi:MAG TPA: calcium-binding protein [Crinalium sp.]
MARIRHRNKRARGTVGANASSGDPTDFNVNIFPWNEEFANGRSIASNADVVFGVGETSQNLPLTVNNDGQVDGNNTLIWTIDDTANFGFSQSVYRFNESVDGPYDGDFGGTDVQIPLQLGSSIKTATIIIEDADSPSPIFGTANGDTLTGTNGIDAIYGGGLQLGGGSASIISTGTGDDTLKGLGGDDSLYGWDGNDHLNGGPGNDYLLGGGGSDHFEFYDPSVDGADLLPDFDPASDTIDIYVGTAQAPNSAYKTAGLTPNTAITADQFVVGTAAIDASDRFIYDDTTGDLFFDPDGTGSKDAVLIANLPDIPTLSNRNIVTFSDPVAPPPPPPPPPNPSKSGTPGSDRLVGTNGSDTLLGLGGDDVLLGGAGSDILDGGTGNNKLLGGLGRDVFVLRKGAGRSVIKDFKDRQDKLGLLPTIQFKKLKWVQMGRDTQISYGKDVVAILQHVQANHITRADFVTIAPSRLSI